MEGLVNSKILYAQLGQTILVGPLLLCFGETMSQLTATILGRGHSGTRLGAQILQNSGFWMGPKHNDSDDLLPLGGAYEAAHVIGRSVEHDGGLNWSWDHLHTGEIPQDWIDAWKTFIRPITKSPRPLSGWKLPETILSFPWLFRGMSDTRFIWWVRDPRDCILKHHVTPTLRPRAG